MPADRLADLAAEAHVYGYPLVVDAMEGRAKPPARTTLDELRVRDPLRHGAPAGGETQLGYGSLRSSTGAIQLRPGIHL